MWFLKKAVFVFVIYLALFSALFISGCSDPEASARKLFSDAMTLQQEGKMKEALTAYKELVDKYPETQTAVEANKLLLASATSGTILRSALESVSPTREEIRQIQKTEIEGALDIFRLDNGRYPTTEEGLQTLVEKPADLGHWNGPYLKNTSSTSTDRFQYRGPSRQSGSDYLLIETP